MILAEKKPMDRAKTSLCATGGLGDADDLAGGVQGASDVQR